MKKVLLAILVAPLIATATEVDDSCNLIKAKADLTASLLSMPYIHGSISNAPNDKTANASIAYSFNGRSRGKLTRELADVKCSSLAVTSILDEQQRWLFISIDKEAAKAELVKLLEARKLLDTELPNILNKLKENTITLAEYNSVLRTQIAIANRIGLLKSTLAEASLPVNVTNLQNTLSQAKSYEIKIQELTAKIEAENSWDITASMGGSKELGKATNISSNASLPFAAVTFRWSFDGYNSSKRVENIKAAAEKLYSSSSSGYVQTYDRIVGKIQESVIVEEEKEAVLNKNIADTSNIITSLKSINTVLSNTAKFNMEIQSIVDKAELAGIQKRIEKYRSFLSRG